MRFQVEKPFRYSKCSLQQYDTRRFADAANQLASHVVDLKSLPSLIRAKYIMLASRSTRQAGSVHSMLVPAVARRMRSTCLHSPHPVPERLQFLPSLAVRRISKIGRPGREECIDRNPSLLHKLFRALPCHNQAKCHRSHILQRENGQCRYTPRIGNASDVPILHNCATTKPTSSMSDHLEDHVPSRGSGCT